MTDDDSAHDPESLEPVPTGPRPLAPPDGDVRVVDRRWWARGEPDAASAGEETGSDKPTYVQELEQRLAARDDELRTTISRYRDANAEFEQARARIRRDVARDVERGRRAILVDLLDVLDNLDRAVAAARTSSPGDPLLQGVELVRNQFLEKLRGYGVAPIDVTDALFDPARHEAATTVPVSDPRLDGRVVGVVRQGYAIGDDLLRPAIVAVARLTIEGVSS